MSEEISAKDTQISMLQTQVKSLGEDNARLQKRLEATEYFVHIHFDLLRKITPRDHQAVMDALSGKIERPILHEVIEIEAEKI